MHLSTTTSIIRHNLEFNHPIQSTYVAIDTKSFDLTWKDILYDDGPATSTPRSSIRWLTVIVCLIGVLGKYMLNIIFRIIDRLSSSILGNLLAVCTLLRRRMRTLSTYAYLTALCLSNTITLLSVIIFELDVHFAPDRFNCIVISLAKASASSTFALSTWYVISLV
jgi:hypothetical protein